MKVCLFSALLAHWALVIGIKLEKVVVPQYAIKDGSVTLSCDFDLETDLLLVLKWYKDAHEFFRVSPQTSPHKLIFPVDGITVDITRSNLYHVILKDINLKSSGTYKCEISADRSFQTLSKQGYMIVIAPPLSNPEIIGVHPVISVGDTLNATCKSFHTKPPAALAFWLNGHKAEAEYMIEYLPLSETNGLETSVLGLRFQVEPKHFQNGVLELKCTATIGNGYWIADRRILEANINAQPSVPGRNDQLSDCSTIKNKGPGIFLLLLLLATTLL